MMEPPKQPTIEKKSTDDPLSACSHYENGNALFENGNMIEALSEYDKAIELNPRHAQAYTNRALVLQSIGQLDQALESCNHAIEINPTILEAYINRGNIHSELGNFSLAVNDYDNALYINTNSMKAHYNKGNALQALRQWEKSITCYENIVRIEPQNYAAFFNIGLAWHQLMQWDNALKNYALAIEYNPNFFMAYNNSGAILYNLNRWTQALLHFNKTIEINPHDPLAHNNQGAVLQSMRQPKQALLSFNQAIQLDPTYAQAYFNRAVVLEKMNRFDEAINDYKQLISIMPNYDFAKGSLLHVKMLCGDWSDFNQMNILIKNDVLNHKKVITPFQYQAISDSEYDLLICAKIAIDNQFSRKNNSFTHEQKWKHQKIRIGYVSGEFRNQATSVLLAQTWELHNKNEFEIIAFDNGWDDGSHLRNRISRAFDEIIDISNLSDLEAANLIHEKEIDILVNLNIFFGETRQGVFAFKPSPIQVNYLGFPGTSGSDYMDYLIADNIVIPKDSQHYYSEKIAYLPHSYQANDQQRIISSRAFSRHELGLPQHGFVYCCFNSTYKITPPTFERWMQILKSTPNSVLWLLQENLITVQKLRSEAMAQGIDPARLIFAEKMPHAEHLARHRAADLFLDTLPYNAHTTASDALWAGLPVLTCQGKTFPGRVASSLLAAVGLPELITLSQQDYERLAIELAANPTLLNSIKQKLQHNRLNTPLFDTPLFTHHLEDLYKQMMNRYRSNQPIDHLYSKSAH